MFQMYISLIGGPIYCKEYIILNTGNCLTSDFGEGFRKHLVDIFYSHIFSLISHIFWTVDLDYLIVFSQNTSLFLAYLRSVSLF